MSEIHPLVICGGNGTRLWPVSRTQSPKQFQRVAGEGSQTFFQAAVCRHQGEAFGRPVIVTGERHCETVRTQLLEVGVEADVIAEPMGRNTGPAVLAASLRAVETDPEAVMLVVPADHVIEGDVNATIRAMRPAARDGHIITFGIKPRYAETGFGYITDAGPVPGYEGLHKVARFVEKPPIRKARLLAESDIAYWASGISMFSAQVLIDEYAKYDPGSVSMVRQAIADGRDGADGTLHLDEAAFGAAAAEPTESLVFEKTERIALAPLKVTWSDVGSWSAMFDIQEADDEGNVLQGDVIAVETENSMIRSSTRLVTVVGLTDVIVIETPDALLVTKVGHCQSVKKVAEHLKALRRKEAEYHERTEHAWGYREHLVTSERIDLSTLTIRPEATMHIPARPGGEVVVLEGEVRVTRAGRNRIVPGGERISLEGAHPVMLTNVTDGPVEMVQMTVAQPHLALEDEDGDVAAYG